MGMLAAAPVIAALSGIPGQIGEYFKQKASLQLEMIKTQREVEAAKQQLAMEVAKAQLELNKTIVASTGAYFKYFTFFMWFGPFIIGTISPARANDIFTNWAGMPDWYVQSCILIMFTVWGISVSAPVVSSIFSNLTSFISDRKDAKRYYQLEKAKIYNDAKFYQVLRDNIFKAGMTQQQVDVFEEALKAREEE